MFWLKTWFLSWNSGEKAWAVVFFLGKKPGCFFENFVYDMFWEGMFFVVSYITGGKV